MDWGIFLCVFVVGFLIDLMLGRIVSTLKKIDQNIEKLIDGLNK